MLKLVLVYSEPQYHDRLECVPSPYGMAGCNVFGVTMSRLVCWVRIVILQLVLVHSKSQRRLLLNVYNPDHGVMMCGNFEFALCCNV